MPAKRKARAPAGAASQSTNAAAAADSQPGKRVQHCLPAAFAQLSSAVVRVCVLSYLQLPELFELRHVSAAFTALCDLATVDWMQRAFPSAVQHYSRLAQRASEKELRSHQLRLQRMEQLGLSATETELPPAGLFTFTLSDARFVRGVLQRLGVAGGGLSSRRVSQLELVEHFKNFPGSGRMARHVGGHRSAPSCSLQEVLEALFDSFGHVDDYLRWREKDAAKERSIMLQFPLVFQRKQAWTASAAVERRWRSGSSSRPLLLLLPDTFVDRRVFAFLEFTEIMDLRAVCSTLKPVCECHAVLWMTATFHTALAVIERQQAKQEEKDDVDDEKREEVTAKVKAASMAPSVLSPSSSSASSSPYLLSRLRLPAAGGRPLPPSSFWAVSSSSSQSSSAWLGRLPAASFSVADCVWLRRQLNRAQWLKANQGWRRYVTLSTRQTPLTVNAVEAADWLGVDRAELQGREVETVKRYASREERYDMLDVVRVVLEEHGSAAGFTRHERERRRKRMGGAAQRQRAVRRQAVDAALAAEGLQAEWGPDSDPRQSWFCQQAEFEWRKATWRRKLKRRSLKQGSPQLHRILVAFGMRCEGNCEWGGCGLGENKKTDENEENSGSAD